MDSNRDKLTAGPEPCEEDEDSALFRRQVSGVRPLVHHGVVPPRRRPPPVPRQTLADEAQVLRDMLSDDYDPAELETGDEVLYARPGLQHGLLRKLRRGQYSVRAELDLHGMTVALAHQVLAEFLTDCLRTDIRCVRIIHGKGRGSPQRQPVLKAKVGAWLRQRDEVLAFCSARPVDGGTGALYVLLKGSARRA
jgi:DNA-nicking Smr family endonuclease